MPSDAKSPSFSWSERAAEQLRSLTDHPILLLLILLAANAIVRPYANVAHDTRLYSVQVLNQTENGIFGNDLFFRHGSQDSFSLFSRLLAPLVKLIGLEWAFFLVYLAATAALFAALIRLVGRLVDDRLSALLCLLYMAVAPLSYGGHEMLRVHESFLTARLPAVALTLFGLDYLLQARYGPALALVVAAGLLHPLMAVGGLFLWAGVFMVDKLGWKRSALIAGGLGLVGAVVLAIPSLGQRLLGSMDEEWCEAVRRGSPFTFPSEWELHDWTNIILCLGWVGAGMVYFHMQERGTGFPARPPEEAGSQSAVSQGHGMDGLGSPSHARARARFFTILLLLGLAATLGNILAFSLPYALLMQGQPFRALWILKVFEVPIGFMLALKLWRSGFFAQQALALLLLMLFITFSPTLIEWYILLGLLVTCIIYLRGLAAEPRTSGWMMKSVAAALILSRFVWMFLIESYCFRFDGKLSQHLDLFDLVQIHLDNFGVLPWMMVFLALVLAFTRAGRERALGLTCAGVFVAVQTTCFVAPGTAFVRDHGSGNLGDIRYARDFLQHRQSPSGQRPTVYSAYGKIEYVWLELRTNNYFDWWMAGGFIFQRSLAIEGQRRALVAGPFEVARFRSYEDFLQERIRREVKIFFQRDMQDSSEPTLADLARLCEEPELDYAILRHKFGDLYEASNGSVYIYDCRRVRAALSKPAAAGGAVASLTPSRSEVSP